MCVLTVKLKKSTSTFTILSSFNTVGGTSAQKTKCTPHFLCSLRFVVLPTV